MPAQVAEDLDQIGPVVAALAQLVAEVVHDDFGVDVAGEVVVGLGEELVAQFGEVGELAVEGEGEPFPFAAVMALERLGVAAVGGAAGGVADVADGGPARELAHDAVVLGLVIEAEGLDDRADLLVGVEQIFALRVEGGEAGGELAAVLQIEQHPRHQAGDLFRPGQGRQPEAGPPGR